MHRTVAVLPGILLAVATCFAQVATPPALHMENGASQLLVHGKPFLVLGGELSNSAAGTAGQADQILPRMKAMNLNTVLMPVAWEQIEPAEGSFDFTILDHWIDAARTNDEHLVLLWFGSWKNGFSEYAPGWVKTDVKRFPRAVSADGRPLEILSTFADETLRADARAFARLMKHVREKDAAEQTVLMVQVENEVGYLGAGRDRSAEADRQFALAPPVALMAQLSAHREQMQPELAAEFNTRGSNWRECFGAAANEAFMAWRYAQFMDAVAAAGKQQYALPLYTNAQMAAPGERAGEYPSGGPQPYNLDIYRAMAAHIDMFSPDIYWPDFEHWVGRYQVSGNPLFVPEARLDAGAVNAFYTIGAMRAFGFSPFAVDLQPEEPAAKVEHGAGANLAETYAALEQMRPLILEAQLKNQTRALVLHANGLRQTRTVALGGYLFTASISRSWPAKTLLADDGAMLIAEAKENEFYVAGRSLNVMITRDPDVENSLAGIERIEEVKRDGDGWTVVRRLNGDESDQGRQLQMDPHRVRIYRVVVFNYRQGANGGH